MTDQGTAENELLQLLEQLADLVLAGDHEECQRVIKQHPQHAEELESVLPSIRLMHDVKSCDASGVGAKPIPSDDPHLNLQGRLGDFQLVREIGRGGMGVVYEAQQLLLGRRVALKVLPLAGMLDERQRTRFENEARAAATLNHSNIVPIHFVGIERGVHFYAMQFVQGHNLATLLQTLRDGEESASNPNADTKPDIQAELSTLRTTRRKDYYRSIAKIGIEIAEALQHAHSHGIIHRDIKPSNIMLDAKTGNSLVTDFGLARLEGTTNVTMTGDVVGTLRYAPPEQALGKQSIVDERVDIYSLGATLYELLSMFPVRDAKDREALLQQIVHSRPKSLRSFDPLIPAELATIVHKCLEHDPEDRYPCAEDVAEDLRRFRAYRPLKSRPPSVYHRSSKWVKRHPAAIMLAALVMLLLLAGTTTAVVLLNREQARTAEQRDQANSNLQIAVAALDEVYSEVGSRWIAGDRNLSDTQMIFLRRSADMLTEIANRFEPDSSFQTEAGLAHLHAADANARILRFDKAASGYGKSRDLLSKAVADAPTNMELRESLAVAELRCGKVFVAVWDFTAAREAFDASIDQYRSLLATHPTNVEYRVSLLSLETELAQLSALDLLDDVVVRVTTELRVSLKELTKVNPDLASANHLNLVVTELESRSLRRLGKTDDAIRLCENALSDAAFPLQDLHDHRSIARAMAALTAELGRCQLDAGDVEEAEKNLRAALSQVRNSFIFDGTPKAMPLR